MFEYIFDIADLLYLKYSKSELENFILFFGPFLTLKYSLSNIIYILISFFISKKKLLSELRYI
jgi:hypothetical protein